VFQMSVSECNNLRPLNTVLCKAELNSLTNTCQPITVWLKRTVIISILDGNPQGYQHASQI